MFFRSLGKRSALHISDECFTIFGISFIMPKNSVYADRLNDAIHRLQQSGLILKLTNEMEWEVQKQHSKGGLLKTASAKQLKSTDVEERGLTLADTEGMFLLMGIGYLLGVSVLVSEVIGGCANKCRQIARRTSVAAESFLPNISRKTSISIVRDIDGITPPSTDLVLEPMPYNIVRRQSDQFGIIKRNPLKSILGYHRRHNSLISGSLETFPFHYGFENDGKVSIVKLVEENQYDIDRSECNTTNSDSSSKIHTVEINRVPTPYTFDDEIFGEKIN